MAMTMCHRCRLAAPADYFGAGWATPVDGPYWLLCPDCYAGLRIVRAQVLEFQSEQMRIFKDTAPNRQETA